MIAADFFSLSRFAGLSLAVSLAGWSPTAYAANPAPDLGYRSGLELAAGTKARAGRTTRIGAPPRALAASIAALEAETGPSWITWDEDTDVPSRITVRGIAAPGTVALSAEALAFARAFLNRHIQALAPGSTSSDFVVVANELDVDAGIRSVGFAQHHRGTPVLGGQVSFRFKHDHLIAIASEALPHIQVAAALHVPLNSRRVHDRAVKWIDADIPGARGPSGPVEGPFVLPIIAGGSIEYREVMRVVVPVDHPQSQWAVYIDAQTGDRVAREQTRQFATAQVLYNTPDRYPGSTRSDYPALSATIADGGATLQTDGAGTVTFAASPSVLEAFASGPLVTVLNQQGPAASETFDVVDGGTAVWDARDSEFVDAQVTAFIHSMVAKDYVRNIAPSFSWLDQQMTVVANLEGACRASAANDTISLHVSSDECENTGRIPDVIYHEVAHLVHIAAIIPGVGALDVGLSEGIADYLAATITEDSGIARGFRYDDNPLRDFDPPDYEYRWPEDRGEAHDEGRIIGGALWDLRKLLIAKLGAGAGVAQADRIWYQSIRRAADMPSMYAEALVADDDDGNLANGTPNGCEINEAFGAHGLFSLPTDRGQITADSTAAGIDVSLVSALPPFPDCPAEGPLPTLRWRTRPDSPETSSGESSMTLTDGVYQASIPLPESGTVIQYQVDFSDIGGVAEILPDNIADPWYELYVGDIVELYCTSFSDGSGSDWSLTGGFEVGLPDDNQSELDPNGASDGDGFALHMPGEYGSDTVARATSPVIDTQGYSGVRLQYRRWLTVVDGFWDTAAITVDKEVVWQNSVGNGQLQTAIHHIDKEWRFQDVDLSDFVDDGQVQISFELDGNRNFDYGGWTIDELCVVAEATGSQCGDGFVDPGEECDDGNLTNGDGCSDACVDEASSSDDGLDETTSAGDGGDSGGGAGDTGGGLSDGGVGDTSGGTDESGVDAVGDGGCGCSAARPSPVGVGGLWIGGVFMVLRRRRSTRRRRSG